MTQWDSDSDAVEVSLYVFQLLSSWVSWACRAGVRFSIVDSNSSAAVSSTGLEMIVSHFVSFRISWVHVPWAACFFSMKDAKRLAFLQSREGGCSSSTSMLSVESCERPSFNWSSPRCSCWNFQQERAQVSTPAEPRSLCHSPGFSKGVSCLTHRQKL